MKFTKNLSKLFSFGLLFTGIALMVISVFDSSSFLAITSLSLIFWGTILVYIMPTRNVPLTLLNTIGQSGTSNIERILNELGSSEKGVYLPPKNVQDIDSSIVFIPESSNAQLPSSDDITDKLCTKIKSGVLITPPGYSLSRLFELSIGESFIKNDFAYLQMNLPKLLTEKLEIADKVDIRYCENTVIVELTNNILDDLCKSNENQVRTHKQVGCLLSSSLACIFAKALGKPISIQSEDTNREKGLRIIHYIVREE